MFNINLIQTIQAVQRIKPAGMVTMICHVDVGFAAVKT